MRRDIRSVLMGVGFAVLAVIVATIVRLFGVSFELSLLIGFIVVMVGIVITLVIFAVQIIKGRRQMNDIARDIHRLDKEYQEYKEEIEADDDQE